MLNKLFFKKLLARYGIVFFAGYAGGFIFLITIHSRFSTRSFPGDLFIQRENFEIYIPFVSSLVISIATVVGFEIFQFFKRH